MTPEELRQHQLAVIEANPRGDAAQMAATWAEAMADCLNNILDVCGDDMPYNLKDVRGFIHDEAKSWGLLVDAEGVIHTGIPE